MVDITQPSIMGYAITPRFIILCSCIIGTIVFAILVVSGFLKRGSKEREMIENAVKNTSNVPVKNIEISTTHFSTEGQEETEAIFGDNTGETDSFKTEGFGSDTEGLIEETEGLDLKTEGLVMQTEGLDMKAESWNNKTEGLVFDSATEAFGADHTEAIAVDETESFVGNDNKPMKYKSKFCSRCGNKVSGNFCSHCGHQINQ